MRTPGTILFFLVLVAVAFGSLSAKAGDFADREIIGFSPDGNLFAFEQFGVQDGSGFAYSDIFIIDTNTDSWTKGSPYRVLLKDETMTLAQARKKSRTMAAHALVSITDRGIIAASNRADEKLANPYVISVKPRSFFLPGNSPTMDFTVELVSLPPPDNCEVLGADSEIFGFRLLRSDSNAPDNIVIMNEDSMIPKSRNCPLDYFPADVIFHYTEQGKYVVAVLVRVERFGFEGRDGRYLAVTGALN